MTLIGTVDAVNARIDLFVDWTTVSGVQLNGTLWRHVGSLSNPEQYVRGLYGSALLGEQAYVSDHEAPLDEQIWYTAISSESSAVMTAGPFTIPAGGYVWMKDPGRPWADLRLDLCVNPSNADPAACVTTSIVTDTFTRSVTDGWGSATSGQAWTNTGGAAGDYDVNGTRGTHTHTAVDTPHNSTVAASGAAQNVVVGVSPPVVATGAPVYAGPVLRFTDTDNLYWARLSFGLAGVLQVAVRKRVAGVESAVGAAVTLPFTYTAGQTFNVRFQVSGPALHVRVWPDTVTEGDDWDLITSDTSLVAAGSVGVRSQLDAATTNALPVILTFDNFTYFDPTAPLADDMAWVGFQDKIRDMDAGLFPVLENERPADVYARRKDITTGASWLTRSLLALDATYELYTAGGPILFQVPDVYGMSSKYGLHDRYYQPGNLNEAYLSQDQRKPLRLWSVPLTAVNQPVGQPQGTDTANWCAVKDTYPTFADLTATGYSWGQAATGQASTPPTSGLYGGGTYGGGFYGG